MFFSTGVWDEGTTRSRTSDHRFDPIWAPFGLHFGAIGPQLGLILKVAPILIPILAQELALAGLVGLREASRIHVDVIHVYHYISVPTQDKT